MGPRTLRATSRKAATELPETARANFLTAAAQLVSVSLPQLSAHLGQQALQVRVLLLLPAACCCWHGLSVCNSHSTPDTHACLLLSSLLQYVDIQQVLLSSVTARAQLCKKCGNPLNPQTCRDVHIAWLSEASQQRLSKRLTGSSAAGGRSNSSSSRGSSGSRQDTRLVNRVATVRTCKVRAADCCTE